MQAGHYVPAGAGNSCYFDERNVHCQCYRCNIMLYGNMDEYAYQMKKKYGDQVIEELRKKKRTIKQFSISELEELLETYKQKLKNL